MKNLIKITATIFAITMFASLFTSCKKDKDLPTPETTTEVPNETVIIGNEVVSLLELGGSEGMENDSLDINYCDCFDLFANVDWTANEGEIIAQLEAILAGLSDDELEELLIPVCTDDGEVYPNACVAECNGVVDFEVCEYDDEIEFCFEFAYPIRVVLPGGNNIEVNSDDELIDTVEDWYDANPTSDEDPTLDYPVDAVLDDGTPVTINNDDDLEALFENCDDDGSIEDCFTFDFPLELVFPDSSIVAINSLDEGETVVEDWYDANPTVDEDVTFVFPFDVILTDDTLQTINNEQEFEDLIEDCDEWCFVKDPSRSQLSKEIAKIK